MVGHKRTFGNKCTFQAGATKVLIFILQPKFEEAAHRVLANDQYHSHYPVYLFKDVFQSALEDSPKPADKLE